MTQPVLQNEKPQSVHDVQATRLTGNSSNNIHDSVAVETPIALVVNGEPYVVMMATPDDLEDFAIGFCITENIISTAEDIHHLDITPCERGLQIHIRFNAEAKSEQVKHQRNLTGRTGCGLCGTALIEDAVRNTPFVNSTLNLNLDIISRALAQLELNQHVKNITGAVHAAAWFDETGQLIYIREDVGRHNALDKLVGKLFTDKAVKSDLGFIVITSRASYEMVTKSAFAGVPILVAVSAPTSLAIEIAEKSCLTLVGFARDESCVIYTHPERIVGKDNEYR